MSEAWERHGEYKMSDTDRQRASDDHDAIARLEGRLLSIERFTGIDGVNGLMQQMRDLKKDMENNFALVYQKLDAMEIKRDEATKWRLGTVIAAVSSLATLGALLYMMIGG